MLNIYKKIVIWVSLVLGVAGCSEASIFPNIPLTLDPVVLANPLAMAASASSNRLYVVNSNNRVNYFDASFIIMDITNPIFPVGIAAISIANYSGQIILDESRGYVYLPNRQSSSDIDDADQVLRININEASPGFLTVEEFPSGNSPFGAFWDGTFFFTAAVAQALQYNVDDFSGFTQVDLDVLTNEGRELEAEDTRELAIAPSDQTVWVTNRIDNMLILNRNEWIPPAGPGGVDLGQEAVDYIVTGTNSTRGITRDSTYVYVVDGAPPLLRILTDAGLAPVVGAPVEIAISTLQVGSIPVGVDPSEVIVDENNMRAYVSNTGEDTVSVIDLNLQQEIARVSVSTTDTTSQEGQDDGDQPFAMVLVEIGGTHYLYVAHFQTNLITVINADTLAVLNTFPVE
jgi:YVTN family beta-propeller protein